MAESAAQALRGEARARRRALSAARAGGRPRGRDAARRRWTVERKADVLRACDERARAARRRGHPGAHRLRGARRQVEVFGSEGRAAADDRTRVRLSAQVVARRDGRVETGTDTRGGHAGWELIAAEPEQVAETRGPRAR